MTASRGVAYDPSRPGSAPAAASAAAARPGKHTLVGGLPDTHAGPAAASAAIQRRTAGAAAAASPGWSTDPARHAGAGAIQRLFGGRGAGGACAGAGRAEAIQRKPDPAEAGYLADEYPDHADLGRNNDCGPAAILMILRIHGWQAQLDTAMNADPVFCARYPASGVAPPSTAGSPRSTPSTFKQPGESDAEYLERRQIHWIRTQITGADGSADEGDYAISVDYLATHITPLLHKIGLTDPEFAVVMGAVTEKDDKTTVPGEGFLDPGAAQGQYIGNQSGDATAKDAPFKSTSLKGNDKRLAQALSYMKSKLLEGAAILLLGNPGPDAWGWGGKEDPQRQGTDAQGQPHRTAGITAGAGHFVVLYDYQPASGEKPTDVPGGTWTILDPTFREPRTATCEQLDAFWENFAGTNGPQLKPIVVSRSEATQAVEPGPSATAPAATKQPRRAGAPIQRQADGKDTSGPPVYQYAAGTLHANDCGPASVLMVLRTIGVPYEQGLVQWIAAHRPIDKATGKTSTAYLQHYGYADASAPVGTQEELDVVRLCAASDRVGLLKELPAPAERGKDGAYPDDRMLRIQDLRPAIFNLMKLLGGTLDRAQINAVMQLGTESADFKTDQGGALGEANLDGKRKAGGINRDTVKDYLVKHVTGDEVVIVLGSPYGQVYDPKTKQNQTAEVAWGWGGTDPSGGGRNVGDLGGGHFVVVRSYDPGTRLFTVLDPSWAAPKQATGDQIIDFLDYKGSSTYNVMSVQLDQLRGTLPVLKKSAGAGAGAAGEHGPETGVALPEATRTRMESAFGADFSGVTFHEGGAAGQVGALAYTQGEEVHFAPGQYRPGSRDGDELIGHELAHVVQQRQGRVASPQGKDSAVVEDAALETEADREGARAAAGQPAGAATGATGHAAGGIQRKAGGGPPQQGPQQDTATAPIPPALLQQLAQPDQVIAVADQVRDLLIDKDQMRAWWSSADPAQRGAQLGEMAVRLGRLEFMFGWIQQGGLNVNTEHGWETAGTADDNQSKHPGDTTSNTGSFPDRYQSIYNGGKGMQGYDWCGMLVGYIYNVLLELDDGGLGADGLEGWRGGDSVYAAGGERIWPRRNVTAGDASFGDLLGWDGGEPRPGDVLIVSHDEFTPGLGNQGKDTRTRSHVAMVESFVADQYLQTIDGNSALQPSDYGPGSKGARQPSAVSGRGYNFAHQYTDTPGKNYYYNQSRMVCVVRMTDRDDNFQAAAGAAPAVSGEQILARLDAASKQVEGVLNAQSKTTTPFDSSQPVRQWVKGLK
jgi:hypothetical protein